MSPSPHSRTAWGGLVPLRVNVGSFWQVGPQPSPAMRLPSSQPSSPSLILLPHSDSAQSSPASAQTYPASRVQLAPQPSPGSRLPSSHCSLPVSTPSPHSGTHARLARGHTQPLSTAH